MLRPSDGRYVSGYRIRQWRQQRGLSQSALSQRAGVSEELVKYLESKPQCDPRGSTIYALAEALEVEPEALFIGPTPDPIEQP